MRKTYWIGITLFLLIPVVYGLFYLQNSQNSLSHNQDEIHQYISQLEQQDAELDRQILLLDSWNFSNYDALNKAYSQFMRSLQSPPRLPPQLYRAISPIRTVLEQKFHLVEQLKTNSALLRNSVNYLPKISQILYANIERAKRNGEIDIAKAGELKQFLQQEMLHVLTYQLVDGTAIRNRHVADVSQLSLPFQADWFSAMKHLSYFLSYRQTSSALNTQINESGLAQNLAQLSIRFSRYLEELDQQGERRQWWLVFYVVVAAFLVALLVLALRHYRVAHKAREDEAFTDALTGLGNRRMLERELPILCANAVRQRMTMGVLFIDLDGFKAVNDTLGHQRGDELLQDVAQRFTQSLRQGDLVARYGGDEFVLVISGASKSVLERIAKNLLDLCQISLDHEGGVVSVSASIGISIYPDNALNGEQLLTMADKAMYQAKERGKSCYQL